MRGMRSQTQNHPATTERAVRASLSVFKKFAKRRVATKAAPKQNARKPVSQAVTPSDTCFQTIKEDGRATRLRKSMEEEKAQLVTKLTGLLELQSFDDRSHILGKSPDFHTSKVKPYLKEARVLENEVKKAMARVEASPNKQLLNDLLQDFKDSLLAPLLMVRDTVNACFLVKTISRDIVESS